jgi:hypothetical protein
MKIDEEQQVRELLQGSARYDAGSQARLMTVKKFVYKLLSDATSATGASRVPISTLWQRYFKLPDAEQLNKESGAAFLNGKDELVDALQHMEAEDPSLWTVTTSSSPEELDSLRIETKIKICTKAY